MSVLSDMLKNVGDPAANESMLLTILSEKKDATDLKVYRNPHSVSDRKTAERYIAKRNKKRAFSRLLSRNAPGALTRPPMHRLCIGLGGENVAPYFRK